MADEQKEEIKEKKEENVQLDKLLDAKPQDATITFDIPAYKDKDGKTFARQVTIPTKKAYAIYKNLVRWKYSD